MRNKDLQTNQEHTGGLPLTVVILSCSLYAILLGLLSGVRPFWLDELLQLVGTKARSGAELLQFVRTFPGTAPLSYLFQHWAILVFGFSAYSARLPAVLCGALSSVVLSAIATRLGVRAGWFLLLMWFCLPLQLRYALEGRPYSQGILLAAVSTLCFLRLVERTSVVNAALYALANIITLYSTPYALFLQIGFLGWSVWPRPRGRLTVYAAGAIATAGLFFFPWYISSVNLWRGSVSSNANGFAVSSTFPLLVIREMSGGGYVCSLTLIALFILGCLRPGIDRGVKLSLVAAVLAGIALPILTDWTFGYFFAIRQVMFVLIPLALLAAHGLSGGTHKSRLVATGLALILVVGSLIKDWRYVTDRSEDWIPGAKALHSEISAGACIMFVTVDDRNLYGLLDSALPEHSCESGEATRAIAVPSTRYTAQAALKGITQSVLRQGFTSVAHISAGTTNIAVFKQP